MKKIFHLILLTLYFVSPEAFAQKRPVSTATSSRKGTVRPDNATTFVTNGVISAIGSTTGGATNGIQMLNGTGIGTSLTNATLTNASIPYAKFLPHSALNGGVGMVGYSAPHTITNTLSYGFTNLHQWDNIVWQNGGAGVQLEIVGILNGRTATVFEPIQNSDSGGLFYMNSNAPYDVYINSANLYDVNGAHIDSALNYVHGAITSDGGVAFSTGNGEGGAGPGWSYGVRFVAQNTNAWRIYAMRLSSLYGPGLNFEAGGDNSSNPFFISGLAPYESLSVLPDGGVNIRNYLTNRFGDTLITAGPSKVGIAANGGSISGAVETNATVQSAKYLPQVALNQGVGQFGFKNSHTITNTLAYGFTNLHVWDNVVYRNGGAGIQLEIIDIPNGSNATVFEAIQNNDSGAIYYVNQASNYDVYFNSANLYDVNGAHPDHAGPYTHGAVTSDGGIGLGTGAHELGYSYGLRFADKTNGWRITANSLGIFGPGLDFQAGGCNSANPFWMSVLAPYESMKILADGEVALRSGFTNTIGAGITNYSPTYFVAGATANTLTASNATFTNVVGNASGLTNMPFTSLSFTPTTTAFTNIIVGYIKFTNSGTVYTIGVGTNLP